MAYSGSRATARHAARGPQLGCKADAGNLCPGARACSLVFAIAGTESHLDELGRGVWLPAWLSNGVIGKPTSLIPNIALPQHPIHKKVALRANFVRSGKMLKKCAWPDLDAMSVPEALVYSVLHHFALAGIRIKRRLAF